MHAGIRRTPGNVVVHIAAQARRGPRHQWRKSLWKDEPVHSSGGKRASDSPLIPDHSLTTTWRSAVETDVGDPRPIAPRASTEVAVGNDQELIDAGVGTEGTTETERHVQDADGLGMREALIAQTDCEAHHHSNSIEAQSNKPTF
jgi:hypothetical protein